MKALRWLVSFPAAVGLSVLTWAGLRSVFHGAYYGKGLFFTISGLWSTVLSNAVPVVVFTLAGVVISPSTKRMVVFGFCGIAPLFSGSAVEILMTSMGRHGGFALASLLGIAIGCVGSLFLGLRVQSRRSKKPIQAAQTTPGLRPSVSDL